MQSNVSRHTDKSELLNLIDDASDYNIWRLSNISLRNVCFTYPYAV